MAVDLNDLVRGGPPRCEPDRPAVALAILALVLGFGWLVTGVAGMSGISDG